MRVDSREVVMGFVGVVSKGTVVLPPDANLPDGTEVRVEPLPAKPLSQRLSDVIGIVHGGPPDLAENHDHYLYGTPKK
jgi:hypothetical protein